MNLYRATKTNIPSQKFGENTPCVKLDASGQPIRPFIVDTFPQMENGQVVFVCPKGWARFYTSIGMKGHNGIDWMTWYGEPVYFNATNDNLERIEGVCKTEIDSDGGKGVDVTFQDSNLYWKLRFWHLKDQVVYDGQKIKSGDLIGYADSTGASSGNHLHEGLKPCDEFGNTLYPDNGFAGAVDHGDFPNVNNFQKDFILHILNLKQQLTILQSVYKLLMILKGRQK